MWYKITTKFDPRHELVQLFTWAIKGNLFALNHLSKDCFLVIGYFKSTVPAHLLSEKCMIFASTPISVWLAIAARSSTSSGDVHIRETLQRFSCLSSLPPGNPIIKRFMMNSAFIFVKWKQERRFLFPFKNKINNLILFCCCVHKSHTYVFNK